MTWIHFALAAAAASAALTLLEKKTLSHERSMEFAATLALINAVLTLPFLWGGDFTGVNQISLLLILFNGVVGSIAYFLLTKAVKHMDVSVTSPLIVLGPGITAIAAFILLGEALTRLQAGGIALMVFGAYILAAHRSKRLLDPIRELWQVKYVHYILIALGIYALTAVVDRHLMANMDMDPKIYLALVHIVVAASFYVMMRVWNDGLMSVMHGMKAMGWLVFAAAVLTIAHRLMGATAVSLAPVGLVAAVTRLSALFATIVGGEVFHEKGILKRAIACAVMLLGVYLIAI